jgi:hypothetical protein
MHHQASGLYRGKMKIPSLNVMFALEKEDTSTEHLYYHVEIHSQLLSHSVTLLSSCIRARAVRGVSHRVGGDIQW